MSGTGEPGMRDRGECLCPQSHYRTFNTSALPGSDDWKHSLACARCTAGMNCTEPGITVETLPLAPGTLFPLTPAQLEAAEASKGAEIDGSLPPPPDLVTP